MERPAVRPSGEFDINVLFIGESNSSWTAVALELNMLGEGGSPEEALKELEESIEAQISYAIQNDCLDQIFVPASDEYFEMFEQAKRDELKEKILAGTKQSKPRAKRNRGYQTGGIGLPELADDRFESTIAR